MGESDPLIAIYVPLSDVVEYGKPDDVPGCHAEDVLITACQVALAAMGGPS